jgi:NTP pyrophosphatase (non-canonical NTP hydrolase)
MDSWIEALDITDQLGLTTSFAGFYSQPDPEDQPMITNYIELAMRTNSLSAGLHAVHPDLLHATLGLCDEHFEYHDSKSWLNAMEELGDMAWFVALAGHALDYDPFLRAEDYVRTYPDCPLLAEAIAEFVGIVKKSYAYGAVLDTRRLCDLLNAMAGRIAAIAEAKGDRTLDEVLMANIAKLQARYPDKFTEALALGRDLKTEAVALRAELH